MSVIVAEYIGILLQYHMSIALIMRKTFAQIFQDLLIVGFVLLFFSASLALGAQNIERKNILVLFSFRPTLPVATQWDRGIRSVLESSTSHKMLVNIEYLDLSHFDDKQHIKILLNNLRHKYSNPKPDLIIPVFNSAVDMALKHGPDLFPGVPIVFGALESQFVESQSLEPNITGYLSDNNYTGTLDLALKLHPNTRNVVVVAGAGPIGQGWITACREKFEAYKERVDFTYLAGLTLEDLLEKLAKLPADTVVFSLPVLQDGAGKKFIGNESLSQISLVSSAPVYSVRDVNIGTGIVGGHMGSFEADGMAVGQLGLRILNGEQPEDIPITRASTFIYMFDWRQLKRWSIAEKRLPPGSIVKFKELTVWEKQKEQIVVVLLLLGLQSFAILYLVHQRRTRNKAELELSEKRSEADQLQTELNHMGRVVTVSTLTASLAHEINQPLAAMRSYAQAALRFMDADESPNEKVRAALQGIVSDNIRAADIINRLRDLVKKQEPHRELLVIDLIINRVLSLLNSEIVLRGASIQENLCPNLPLIHADTVQIQQVILNLMLNALDAVSCHPAGSRVVAITTRLEESSLVVSIWDSGDCVPTEDLQRVFEPFHTTKQGGMGLGLTICKSIVEAHDGTIWAECADAGGAVFSFSLPVSRK